MEHIRPLRFARISWAGNDELSHFVRHLEREKTLVEFVEKFRAHFVLQKRIEDTFSEVFGIWWSGVIVRDERPR